MDFALSRLGYSGSRKVRAPLPRAAPEWSGHILVDSLHEESGGHFDPE